MINSNNISVMRENIRKLNELVDPKTISGLITNVEANTDAISDINSLVGATPLPEGSTITSVIDLLTMRTKITGFYGIDITKAGSAIVVDMYTTESKVSTDAYTLQVRPTNNDIRLLIKEGGTTTYNKSVALT